MPVIKSARKRMKTASKANLRNVKTKRSLRDALKAFSKAVNAGNSTQISKAQQEAMSALDMAAKKAVIHKNKAARQKARLSAQAKAAGVKPAKATKAPAAKAKGPAKSPATKAPAKKPAAKKAAPKSKK